MSGRTGDTAAGRRSARAGEVVVSLALIALGAFVIVETQGIRETQTAAGVGPRLFPTIVGSGLALIGGWLGWHALAGGWRDLPTRRSMRSPTGSPSPPSASACCCTCC